MADRRERSPLEALLTCPVCKDVFTEPRQLQCGHSVCMACLETMVGLAAELPFRCPDCRAYFGKKVEVQKSYALASIVEDFKETLKQRAKKATKVYCDCCPGDDDDGNNNDDDDGGGGGNNKTLALKTCLKCEVSLCGEHLRAHLERPAFSGHPLVCPLADLPERRCPRHGDRLLRYYCEASRRYACNMCALEGKRAALVTDAAGALGRRMTEHMDQRFQAMEGKMTETLDSINRLQDEIANEKVKSKPSDSSLNSVTLVLLCLWVIVVYYSYRFSLENQALTDTVNSQQTRLHNIYSAIAGSSAGNSLHLHGDDVKEGEVPLTLDLHTASPHLRVSADLRSVQLVQAWPPLDRPSPATGFDDAAAPRILSTQCFGPGRHQWTMAVEGHWEIAVTHRGVPRTAGTGDGAFGGDAWSWSVLREGPGGPLYALHQQVRTELPVASEYETVVVAVDSREGTVTFAAFGTDESRAWGHEFQARLAEPCVCLGLGLYSVDPPSRARVLRAVSDSQTPDHVHTDL